MREDSTHFLLGFRVAKDVDQAQRQCNSAKRKEYGADDQVLSLHALSSATLWVFDEIESIQVDLTLWFAKSA